MKLNALLEHKDWLTESGTEKVCKTVCAHLKKEAAKYEKRDDYKNDCPLEHVHKEFFDKVLKSLKG